MDKKRSFLNVSVAIAFKIVLLVLTLIARRFLIKYVGNDANGVNSLFLSIVGFLSIAELGISTAINFCMYAPIANGDTQKVSALYNLYVKVYRIIGLIILCLGLLVMPFIPYLAKGYNADFNLYLTFFIMLLSVVITYMYSAKSSLINAYKNNYITTTITSLGDILRYGLQIVVLIYFKSFELYLVCRIVSVLLQWLLTNLYTSKHYKELTKTKNKIDAETRTAVIKNAKAMFMHKIGALLVNTADSIIISAFIGVVILGKYSNYTTIMTAMTGILTLFFTPLTSIMGHLCAKGDIQEEKKYFHFIYLFNFIIGAIFFLGYYAIIDNLVSLFFGADLVLDKSISFIITLNYFIQFMRQAVLLFRDATGVFYYDRYKPLVEGVLNVVLSIAFVQFMGVVGVIVATIVTNILICHIVEPLVLYKNVYNEKPTKFYILNYSLIIIFTACLCILHFCLQSYDKTIVELLVNGFIAVSIALIPCIAILLCSKTFKEMIKKLYISVKNKFRKRKVNE